jgi:26S proteasome regulatory subunit N9
LSILKDTPEQWLVDMLQACAKGDVLEFQKLTQQHADPIAKQPALVHRANAVQEKLTLLALVDLVFEKPSSERTLSFEEIATRLHVPLEQVEWVVMRALSVHLIEGSMDQVDQTVSITWVLPRVLDTAQLQALASRFGEWAVKVSSTKDYMQEQTPTFA